MMTREQRDLRAAVVGVVVGFILGLVCAFAANAQSIQWRLIGATPAAWGTWSCTYEGRMSDGRTTVTTTIHRGFACPSRPGAEF